MGTLTENPVWEAGVRHFEANAVLTGGPDCPDNLPLSDLANRTAWLKQQVETAQGGLARHEAAADPHPQYATDADLAAHAAAVDPHPVYLTSAEGDAKITAAVAALVNSSPTTLDTLAELATALGNDPNFATTLTNLLALKAPLASPAMTGNPTAPTPAQFDNDTSLATTEFVKRQGLQLAGISYYTANTTLPLTDVGKAVFVNFSNPGGTISLPSAATVPVGAIYTVYNWGAQGLSLAAQVGQTINNNTSNPQTFTMQPYSTVTVIAETGTGWVIIGGSGQLTTSPLFSASKTSNGYTKLPNGLILQWWADSFDATGVRITTFPIAFPNAVLHVSGHPMMATGSTTPGDANIIGWDQGNTSLTQARMVSFNYTGGVQSGGERFFAIGC